MITVYDKPKLDELVKNFFNITGITIAIYDRDFEIMSQSPGAMCEFCAAVRQNPILHKKCIECDKVALKKCSNKKEAYFYHCHLGLIELAIPIFFNNYIIGHMLLGQITNSKDTSEILKKTKTLTSDICDNKSTIIKKINSIKYFSDEYLFSLAEIAQTAVDFIWLNNIISVKNNSLVYSIETYIKSNLNNELSINGLCEIFNISISTLYKISKENFNCSITDYIAKLRTQKAIELLNKGEKVYEVANAIGFEDTNYFIRFFKKRTGITPKQYQLQEC